MQKRPTQKDVAARAGVHRSTVSLSLSNHPSIPQETRDRVLAACEELGYRPDPLLSQLAAYRSQSGTAVYRGLLGWLVNEARPNEWRKIPQYVQYFEGAKRRAEFYGYNLEVFESGGAVSPKRLEGILQAKHVSGLLLCPQPRDVSEMDGLSFDHFSCVAMGYSLVRPRFHVVTSHQFHASQVCVQHAVAAGCRRIGFAIPPFHDRRADHNYLAGYLVGLGESGLRPLARLKRETPDAASYVEWLLACKADAVIGAHYQIDHHRRAAEKACVPVPRFFCPSLAERPSAFAGVFENSETLGATAVNQLVGLIRQDEKGIPQHPTTVLVEGEWADA
jgi:LacI family transcriptional regulator/LacI family repressor for deo operon, udp, cdd, tsx, nupC, and nupG